LYRPCHRVHQRRDKDWPHHPLNITIPPGNTTGCPASLASVANNTRSTVTEVSVPIKRQRPFFHTSSRQALKTPPGEWPRFTTFSGTSPRDNDRFFPRGNGGIKLCQRNQKSKLEDCFGNSNQTETMFDATLSGRYTIDTRQGQPFNERDARSQNRYNQPTACRNRSKRV
jgi:hypothetical protein